MLFGPLAPDIRDRVHARGLHTRISHQLRTRLVPTAAVHSPRTVHYKRSLTRAGRHLLLPLKAAESSQGHQSPHSTRTRPACTLRVTVGETSGLRWLIPPPPPPPQHATKHLRCTRCSFRGLASPHPCQGSPQQTEQSVPFSSHLLATRLQTHNNTVHTPPRSLQCPRSEQSAAAGAASGSMHTEQHCRGACEGGPKVIQPVEPSSSKNSPLKRKNSLKLFKSSDTDHRQDLALKKQPQTFQVERH